MSKWQKAVAARGEDPRETSPVESDEFKRHILYMASQEWPDEVPDDVWTMIEELLLSGNRKHQARRNKYKRVLHPRLVQTAAAQPKDRKQTVEEMAALIMAQAEAAIEYKKLTGFLDNPAPDDELQE